jgi:hypothetical protein
VEVGLIRELTDGRIVCEPVTYRSRLSGRFFPADEWRERLRA